MYANTTNPTEARVYQSNLQLRRLQELYRYLTTKPDYTLTINPQTGKYSIKANNVRQTTVVSNNLNRPVVTHLIDKQILSYESGA